MRTNAHTTRTSWSLVLVLGALFLGGGLLVRWALRSPGENGAAVETAREHLPRIAWPVGRRQVYRLIYRSNDDVQPLADDAIAAAGSAPVSSRLSLEATVAVTGEESGLEGGNDRVTFELLTCERASWEIAGGVAWADAAACADMLRGASLGAEVSPRGTAVAILDPPDSEAAVQSILQALWLRLQIALPEAPVADGDSYRAEEVGLQATAVNEYSLHVATDDPDRGYRLGRSTRGLRNVRAAEGLRRPRVEGAGSADIAIDASGTIRSVKGDERVRVATAGGASVLAAETSFHFEWIREEAATARRDVSSHHRRAPASALRAPDVAGRLLDNQIAGLDRETLLATIRTYGNGGRLPDDARFMWRATGLLEKHPELAWELLALYRNPAATAELQARVLDLLASAGHEVAQAVMREALGDPAVLAEGDVSVRHLYQRLGLVREPAPETVEMVAAHYREFRDGGQLEAEVTAAYALGAIVGKLSRGDDAARSLAAIYNAELAQDLLGARDAAELAHRVTALGNARRPENVPVLTALAGHDSPRVRGRVARALGQAAGEAVPPALLDLLADGDQLVQRGAIRVAEPHDDVYGQLTREVSAGGVSELNVRAILDLVKKGRRSHRDATTRLLDALLERGIDDDKDREVALMLRRM